jgi:ERCC4-related helicase
MIRKFVLQSEGEFQDTMERIQEHQEIEDSSLILIFTKFRETVTIISKIKLNHFTFDSIITINDDPESNIHCNLD